jgi:hypothetical protein
MPAGAAVKLTVSTREAAQLLGLNPHRFAEWARAAELLPLRRIRIGRSTLTVWSIADIRAAQKRRYAGQVTRPGGEITTLAVECSNPGPAEVA